jgi:hypothetical protein
MSLPQPRRHLRTIRSPAHLHLDRRARADHNRSRACHCVGYCPAARDSLNPRVSDSLEDGRGRVRVREVRPRSFIFPSLQSLYSRTTGAPHPSNPPSSAAWASPTARCTAPSARGDDAELNFVGSKPRDYNPAAVEIFLSTLLPSKTMTRALANN